MKTERHISLAQLYLLLYKSNTLLFFFSTSLKTLPLFCGLGQSRNIIQHHFFILFWPGLLENSFLFCQPGSVCWKNHLSFVVPTCWKNHLSFARQGMGLMQNSIPRYAGMSFNTLIAGQCPSNVKSMSLCHAGAELAINEFSSPTPLFLNVL